jgi:hypothetical protein
LIAASQESDPGHPLHPGTSLAAVSVDDIGNIVVDLSMDIIIERPIRLDTEAEIAALLAPVTGRYHPGGAVTVRASGEALESFVPRTFGGSGPARDRAAELPPPPGPALVRSTPDSTVPLANGLSGRHIAMWHSHGWYRSENAERWEWQRPRMFTSVEDTLPMSFVLPFLAPMLEDAGAVTLIPRERDFQINEVIVDDSEDRMTREGEWRAADDPGFKPGLVPLPKDVNPHAEGAHLIASCAPPSADSAPSATWTPHIPESGDYAVTVAYGAGEDRAVDAHYIIRHAGGVAHRYVNQRMAGHTWVYLGTFSFEEGTDTTRGSVTLVAQSNDPDATVSADAVRFGGGMGTVEIGGTTSSRPRYLEAAHMWEQYAGAPPELTYRTGPRWNEYEQDYASRPEWVNWLNGAPNGPNNETSNRGGQVPIDLSLAFHTNAGVPDGIFGTLMIYTPFGQDGPTEYPDGRPRWLNRELGDTVQTQIVNDIHATIGEDWTHRELWPRSYAESRRPNVPSILLELASHQNFEDQQSLQDPRFRFLVSRAIYKGMLRWIATENGFDPIVMPLAPTHLRVDAEGPGRFRLAWRAQADPLELTAEPDGYLVYHRTGGPVGARWLVARGGGFGEPVFTAVPSIVIEGLDEDEIHSFRVTAVNRGGESFPTPILAAAWGGADAPTALVVDAFDRIAPAHIVNIPGEHEGFDRSIDRGVGFGASHSLVGDQHAFNPQEVWAGGGTPWNNDHPGHGASLGDMEGELEVGNLFDHTALHVEPLHALGFTVNAMTDEALESTPRAAASAELLDWTLGEERTTLAPPWAGEDSPLAPAFAALPSAHRQIIGDHLAAGGKLILSGAHWADDVANPSSPGRDEAGTEWLSDVLGVQWIADKATEIGNVFAAQGGPMADVGTIAFETGLGTGTVYGCEAPDALQATGDSAVVALRYERARTAAAILNAGRSVCFGFPLECVADPSMRRQVMREALAALQAE